MDQLSLFKKWKDIEEYSEGSAIFSEREPADAVYVILEGEVELSLRGKPLSVEKPGGVIGEMAMVESGHLNATATAKTAVRLARVDSERFRDMMHRNPSFAVHVMGSLANRLRSVDAFISTHMDTEPRRRGTS